MNLMIDAAPLQFSHLIGKPYKCRFYAVSDKDWCLVLSIEGEGDRLLLPRHQGLTDEEFQAQVLIPSPI